MDLRIAHLYAQFLNIYGDTGNLIALQRRAQWRGIEATITPLGLNEELDPERFDLYFIGGGQDKQQEVIAEDLEQKGPALGTAAAGGAVILAVCGGYQLLGHYYRTHEGKELRGISLIDAYTIAGSKRMIGNVVVRRTGQGTIVGFENHSGRTYLGPQAKPLGQIIVGHGNNGEDGFEGVLQGTVYGTYLHGSLLPKNPHLTDELILAALARRHGSTSLKRLDDTLELAAHKKALSFPA